MLSLTAVTVVATIMLLAASRRRLDELKAMTQDELSAECARLIRRELDSTEASMAAHKAGGGEPVQPTQPVALGRDREDVLRGTSRQSGSVAR